MCVCIVFIYLFIWSILLFCCNIYSKPPEQRKPFNQREARWSREFLCSRERADAWGARPAARGGGGRQEQSQPGVITAGGAGEAEEGAECHAAGEEDYRGLGADLQGRDGESKAGSTTTSAHLLDVLLLFHFHGHSVYTVVFCVPPAVSTVTCFSPLLSVLSLL